MLAATRSAASTARKSGHLHSAVDPAAMPLTERPGQVPASAVGGAEAATGVHGRASGKAAVTRRCARRLLVGDRDSA